MSNDVYLVQQIPGPPGGTGGAIAGDVTGTIGSNLVTSISGSSGVVNVKSTQLAWTTPGTVPSPTNLEFAKLQPVDSNKAPFSLQVIPALFNSTQDYGLFWGYNVGLEKVGEPQAVWGLEEDYEVTPGVHKVETYFQYEDVARANVIRPLFFQIDRSTNGILGQISIGPNAGSQFSVLTSTHTIVQFAPGNLTMGDTTTPTQINWTTPAAGKLMGAANAANLHTLEIIGQFGSDQLIFGDGNSWGHSFIRFDNVAGASGSLIWDGSGGQSNLGINSQSYGSGQGVVALKVAATTPSTAVGGAGNIVFWADSANGAMVQTNGGSGGAAGGPQTTFAPFGSGTATSQARKYLCYEGVVTTTNSAAATTILTIPVATTTVAGFEVQVTGRCTARTAGPIVGDQFFNISMASATNVAGSLTLVTTGTTPVNGTVNTASMASCAVTYVVSGTNVLVKVAGISTATIDWSAICYQPNT